MPHAESSVSKAVAPPAPPAPPPPASVPLVVAPPLPPAPPAPLAAVVEVLDVAEASSPQPRSVAPSAIITARRAAAGSGLTTSSDASRRERLALAVGVGGQG